MPHRTGPHGPVPHARADSYGTGRTKYDHKLPSITHSIYPCLIRKEYIPFPIRIYKHLYQHTVPSTCGRGAARVKSVSQSVSQRACVCVCMCVCDASGVETLPNLGIIFVNSIPTIYMIFVANIHLWRKYPFSLYSDG